MGWRGGGRVEEGLSSEESTPQRVRWVDLGQLDSDSACDRLVFVRWVDRERNLGRLDTPRTWVDTPRTAEVVRRGAPPPALRAATFKFQVNFVPI